MYIDVVFLYVIKNVAAASRQQVTATRKLYAINYKSKVMGVWCLDVIFPFRFDDNFKTGPRVLDNTVIKYADLLSGLWSSF